MIENVEVEGEISNVFFIPHSTTDRSKDISKYLNSVSISPIDITQQQLKPLVKLRLIL